MTSLQHLEVADERSDWLEEARYELPQPGVPGRNSRSVRPTARAVALGRGLQQALELGLTWC